MAPTSAASLLGAERETIGRADPEVATLVFGKHLLSQIVDVEGRLQRQYVDEQV